MITTRGFALYTALLGLCLGVALAGDGLAAWLPFNLIILVHGVAFVSVGGLTAFGIHSLFSRRNRSISFYLGGCVALFSWLAYALGNE